ncbi:hypothetical protein SB00610_05362 [Klebsiella quasipneumoniae subsp. similipneumoniae]|nr:hypothetical protein SB00610_05362 [Klebsiella quasipneumoniae subsp. similipneumoniae]
MTADTGEGGDADIPLHAGGHRPQDIVAVKDIDILINQNDVFQFGIGRQCQQRSLSLTTFVGGLTFFHLQDPQKFTAARGVGVDIL